jgi:hypothetical protein
MSRLKLKLKKKKRLGKKRIGKRGPSPASKKKLREMYAEALAGRRSGHWPTKLFTCPHCGGHSSPTLTCRCGESFPAQDMVAFGDKIDQAMVMGYCHKCLALTVGIVRCRGIDPKKQALQDAINKTMDAASVPQNVE